MSLSDRDFWEEFINVYRLYPCLWDKKSKDYMNKQLRDSAYAQLLNRCKERFPNATIEFVKKKIHGFRCSFRRELKKVLNSMESGASAEEVYTPTLWYFNALSFITVTYDYERTRQGVSNFDESSQEEDTISETYMEEMPYSPDIIDPSPSPQSSTGMSRYPQIKTSTKLNGSISKRKEELMDLANIRMKKYCCGGSDSSTKFFKDLDDNEVAGYKYARDLKNLEDNQKIFFEKLVSDLLFYAKQGKLTEDTSINLGKANPITHEHNYVHSHQLSGQNDKCVSDLHTLIQ